MVFGKDQFPAWGKRAISRNGAGRPTFTLVSISLALDREDKPVARVWLF
ncbi:MAG: hypothetical protein N838_10620 [Thiohalocapsa sp. PB-PSB1]|jgi:hypothetical protein|nr:MAG: hypothetical protein N838_10620 [Thiohalocapsa sp. PB-PSB1]